MAERQQTNNKMVSPEPELEIRRPEICIVRISATSASFFGFNKIIKTEHGFRKVETFFCQMKLFFLLESFPKEFFTLQC